MLLKIWEYIGLRKHQKLEVWLSETLVGEAQIPQKVSFFKHWIFY